jgi:hypothetical protein
MKFVRKECIVTTIFDKQITERDEVLLILNNLLEERIDFSMTMRKYYPDDSDYFVTNFKRVRVKKINEDDTVDFLSFKGGSNTKLKNVPFSDVEEINATTSKHRILDVDSDHDRFDILDL